MRAGGRGLRPVAIVRKPSTVPSGTRKRQFTPARGTDPDISSRRGGRHVPDRRVRRAPGFTRRRFMRRTCGLVHIATRTQARIHGAADTELLDCCDVMGAPFALVVGSVGPANIRPFLQMNPNHRRSSIIAAVKSAPDARGIKILVAQHQDATAAWARCCAVQNVRACRDAGNRGRGREPPR